MFLVGQSAKKCTTGFLGRRTDTGALVTVTAGHCLALNNSSGTDYWGHATTPAAAANFGSELSNTWTDYARADVGLVVLNSGAVSALGGSNLNMVHVQDPGYNEPIVGIRGYASQLEGDAVCRMGWGTWNATGQGRTCGIIVDTDVTNLSCESGLSGNCQHIMHTWMVNFDSLPGDSGGPITHKVFLPGDAYLLAYGTHVHSKDPMDYSGWYSPIAQGISAYDQLAGVSYTYEVCITSSC